jgi:hypothetical protein
VDTSRQTWEDYGVVIPDGYWCTVYLRDRTDGTWFEVALYEDFEHKLYRVGTFVVPVEKLALLNRRIQIACTKYRLRLPVYAYKYKPRKRRTP